MGAALKETEDLTFKFSVEKGFLYIGPEDLPARVANLASLNNCPLDTGEIIDAIQGLDFPSSIKAITVSVEGHEQFSLNVASNENNTLAI